MGAKTELPPGRKRRSPRSTNKKTIAAEARYRAIAKAYRPGERMTDLAERLGFSLGTVRNALRAHGIDLEGDRKRVLREGERVKVDAVLEIAREGCGLVSGGGGGSGGATFVDPEMEEIFRYYDRWPRDMGLFVEQALGLDGRRGFRISSQQREACDAVSKLIRVKEKIRGGFVLSADELDYEKKIGISIMAGQGPGKDAWCAWFIIWFLFCFDDVKIPCTAPSADQLKTILWAEVGRWLYRQDNDGNYLVIPAVREDIAIQGDKIYSKSRGDGKDYFAFPKTANPKDDPEAQARTLYGQHSDYMAIIVDEASNVLDPVFRPLEGTLTGAVNFIIMVFNPVRRTGFAVESHTGKFSHKWICLHWSSEESEIVNPQHIKDMEEKYGRGSNTFRTLVLGLPPVANADTLIPYDWVVDAVNRDIEADDEDAWMGGLDPGAGGDNSVFVVRHGMKVESIDTYSSPDTMSVTAWAAGLFEKYMLDILFVDSIGIGNGVYNRLRELGYRVVSVDVRRKARDEEKFANVRAELWWRAREIFEQGTISIPDDQFLKEELWSPRFELGRGKRVEIEDKRKMRKHLGSSRSPNHADALLLTFAHNDAMYRRARKSSAEDRGDRRARILGESNGWMAA